MSKLVIRAKTFRAWFNANLKDRAADIAGYGADGGYPCITYNTDCEKIFDRFQDEIWEMVVDQAEQYGEPVLQFIAGFRRADMADTFITFKTLLVWFACEELSREIVDARGEG